MVRCRGASYCVHRTEVCDGIPHCPLGDDEVLCGMLPCPVQCSCLSLAMTCHNQDLETIPLVSHHMKMLSFVSNKLKLNHSAFDKIPSLEFMNISYNFLSDFCGSPLLLDKPLQVLSALMTIDLSNNQIAVLTSGCFMGPNNLQSLYLQHNNLVELSLSPFMSLRSLQILNISNNKLTKLDEDDFTDLDNLSTLDIHDNYIKDIQISTGRGLMSLQTLYSDDFRICCLIPHRVKCQAPVSLFSSCTSLLKDNMLKLWIWTMGLTSLFLNGLVLYHKVTSRRTHHGFNTHSFLIANLSCADILCGVFLMVIAIADVMYGDQYVIHDYEWRSSNLCHIASVLSSVSFFMSALSLVAITFYRYYHITRTMSTVQYVSKRLVVTATISTWAVCVIWYSGNILAQALRRQETVQSNAMCLVLVVGKEEMSNQLLQSSILNATLVASTLIIVILYAQIVVYTHTVAGQVTGSHNPSKRTFTLSLRVVVITASNVTCWVPVFVVGIMSTSGVQVSPNTMAVIATVVMPINAGINPLIYTMGNVLRGWRQKGNKAAEHVD